jgi:RND family efflux transporter MFP subunit
LDRAGTQLAIDLVNDTRMKTMKLFKLKAPYVWGALCVAAVAAAGLALPLAHSTTTPTDPAGANAASNAPVALVVQAVTAQQRQWPLTINANGSIAAWQEAVVAAEVGNVRIAELKADVGERVKRGQTLALLDSATTRAEVAQLQAAVAQTQASLAQARADAQRTRILKDSGALSAQQIEQSLTAEDLAKANVEAARAALDAAQIRLTRTRVVATDDGEIVSRSATLGAVVQSGTEMFRLMRQSRVEWRAELPAEQLNRIKPDAAVSVVLPYGKAGTGKVRLVAPTLDTSTRTAIVYVTLTAGSGARPGMYANGQIELGNAPALALPQAAVSLRDGRSVVFILVEGNADVATVRQVTVQTGRHQDGQVEIIDGLSAGTRVVQSGVAFLNDADRVRIVAATPATSPAPASTVANGK